MAAQSESSLFKVSVDQDHSKRLLVEMINTELTSIAGPILNEALGRIRIEMRKKLAALLISHIEENVEMLFSRHEIKIVLKQAEEKRHGNTE